MTKHRPRYVPHPDTLIEVTVRTTQSRYLLRPSLQLNRIVAGVLAHALRRHRVLLHGAVFLSDHFHLLLTAESVQELSDFMRLVNRALSGEIGKLHDWSGSMWARRYTSIPVSDEPEAQIGRLKYLLGNSCKEGLVSSPHDWPGIQSATALVTGQPIEGVWIDRTAYHEARKRGRDVSPSDFEETLELRFDPLPCWGHLPEQTWRRHVADLVALVEEETQAMHRQNGTSPAGVKSVLRLHPHQRPTEETRSPKPRFHAISGQVRQRMTEVYAAFVGTYADAAQRLRRGDPHPQFPPNCFPPGLPFVPPERALAGFV